MPGLALTLPATPVIGKLWMPKGTKALNVRDSSEYLTTADATRAAYVIQTASGTGGYLVDVNNDQAHLVYAGAPGIKFTPNPAADCSQAVADARAAEHERTRDAALAAVGGI
jgi:multidrug resistance efflux pump